MDHSPCYHFSSHCEKQFSDSSTFSIGQLKAARYITSTNSNLRLDWDLVQLVSKSSVYHFVVSNGWRWIKFAISVMTIWLHNRCAQLNFIQHQFNRLRFVPIAFPFARTHWVMSNRMCAVEHHHQSSLSYEHCHQINLIDLINTFSLWFIIWRRIFTRCEAGNQVMLMIHQVYLLPTFLKNPFAFCCQFI